MRTYDHNKIEKKWQRAWEAQKIYQAEEDSSKEKQYILDMYPYPSGDGLHVGHVEGYTATDIYSRYMRMRGYNVLHPMGWDAFGLPAENYAVKTGVHPRETTSRAIANFTEQIKRLGLSYDWSREVGTHTPSYYQWTQWFFLLLYKHGLAYKKDAPVNWDPKDQTVLANEQVLPDGTAERSGAKVEQRMMSQWFFKITDYADALVNDLDEVDWPASTITNQRNWIGRSTGAEIDFPLQNHDESISVFTTRPDTLFGATYIVLAPEHPSIEQLKKKIENADEVTRYIEHAQEKSELERIAEGKDKTGVELKGIKAINPANHEAIPIFLADYVLARYGTGAIMAVPAHDQRDYAFALKHDLPVRQVIAPETGKTAARHEPYTGAGVLINSGAFDGIPSEAAKQQITNAVSGKEKTTYKLRDWLISRQRYWGAPIPIVYDPEGAPHPVPEEHLPWLLPDDVDFEPKGYAPLSRSKELVARTERIFGAGWKPEVDTLDTFVCSSWYFFRFADPRNDARFASKEALRKWLPVDLYMGGAEHTVLHLMYARFFTKVLHKLGYISCKEPFLKVRHQGTILAEDGRKMSKSLGNVDNPNDVIDIYGADSVRLYEMFMGPLEDAKPWSAKNIMGVRRFLEKVWRTRAKVGEPLKELDPLLHKTTRKVEHDITRLKLNTAISQMMICAHGMEAAESLSRAQYETFLKVLAPFAPHIAEELWHGLGNECSIHLESWPRYNEQLIAEARAIVAVQINGKLRGTVEIEAGAGEQTVLQAARALPNVSKWLADNLPKKVIYVENRLINMVI